MKLQLILFLAVNQPAAYSMEAGPNQGPQHMCRQALATLGWHCLGFAIYRTVRSDKLMAFLTEECSISQKRGRCGLNPGTAIAAAGYIDLFSDPIHFTVNRTSNSKTKKHRGKTDI